MRFLSFRKLFLRSRIALILVLLALFAAVSARTEEPAVFAISGARIFPVSGAPLEKGTVILRNGIIEAVGANVAIPPDARTLDGTGLTVYPGLIDGLCDAGLEEPRAPQAPGPPSARPGPPAAPAQPAQQAPAPPAAERPLLNSHVQAADLINPTNRKIESARAVGITTALVAPRTGIFEGQSSLVNLSGASVGAMIVKTPVAMHISLQSAGGFGGGYPSSLMGVVAFVKQTFLDAERYDVAWNIYNVHTGVVRPDYNHSLQALIPVLKQELPAVVPGDTPAQIQRAMELAQSFKLKCILSGGSEAARIAPLLKEKGVPVLLSMKFPERDRDSDPELEEELPVLRRRVEAPVNAEALAKAGVQFAFQSGDISSPRDFMRNIARSVEAGLPKDIAMRALTLTAAEIFGVAGKLGSIEKGKTANLTIATGDIFDSRTRVKYVFIDGKKYDITEPEPE